MALGEAFINIKADTTEFDADLEALKARVAATQLTMGVKPSGTSGGAVTTAFTAEGTEGVIADAQRIADAVVASQAEQTAAVVAGTDARVAALKAEADAAKEAAATTGAGPLSSSSATDALQAQILRDELANRQVALQAQITAQQEADRARAAEGAQIKADYAAQQAANAQALADWKQYYSELAAVESQAYAEENARNSAQLANEKAFQDALAALRDEALAEEKARNDDQAALDKAFAAAETAAQKAAQADALNSLKSALSSNQNQSGISQLFNGANFSDSQIKSLANDAGVTDKALKDLTATMSDGGAEAENLGTAFGNLVTQTHNFGSLLENVGSLFGALPEPAKLALLVVGLGAIEAAGIAVVTGISSAIDAALAKVGISAASSIEDTRNNLAAAFGLGSGTAITALSDSLLALSDSSGIAESALGGVVVQLGGLGLNSQQAIQVTKDFANSIDAIGLHGTGATTALTGLESAFATVAKQTTGFNLTNIESFSQIDGALNKTAIVAQLVADGVGKNADAVNKLLAAGKVTTTQGLTAVQQVAAATPQTATPSFGGIADNAKNAIENALGEAFDNPALLKQFQGLVTEIVNDVKTIAPQIEAGFSTFVSFIQSVLPDAFDILKKGTQEAISFIQEFGPDIKGLVADVDEFFTDVTKNGTAANGVLNAFKGFIELIVAAFKLAYPEIVIVGQALGAVGDTVKLVADLLTGNLSGALKDIEGVFVQFADIAITAMVTLLHAIADVADALSHVPGFGWLKDLGNDANSAASDLGGVKSSLDNINNTVVSVDTAPALNALAGLDSAALKTQALVAAALDAANAGASNETTGPSGAQLARLPSSNQVTGTPVLTNLNNQLSPDAAAALAASAGAAAAATGGVGPGGTGGSGGGSSAPTAAQTAATAAATALKNAQSTLTNALSSFAQGLNTATTTAAITSALNTVQNAIDTFDTTLKQKEPTGLTAYLAKEQVALDNIVNQRTLIANAISASATAVSGALSYADSVAVYATTDLSKLTLVTANAAGAGAGTAFASGLQANLTQLKTFVADVNKLKNEGVSPAIISSILAAGPSAGFAEAQDLAAASPATIAAINATQSAITTASNQLGDVAAQNALNAGIATADGFIQGLQTKDADLAAAAQHIGDLISAEVKKVLKIASPSRVTFEHGANTALGLVHGLLSGSDDVVAAANHLANSALPDLTVGGASGTFARAGSTNTKEIHAPITQHFYQSGHDPADVAQHLSRAFARVHR